MGIFCSLASEHFTDLKNTARDGLGRFAAVEAGSTASEYALIGSGIALAVVAIVFSLGNNVLSSYEYVVDQMTLALGT
jgi:Flp pilus assembly pilin Flp